MNRSDFQKLAEERICDAEELLNAQRWSGAYYLAGYSVECGLKACIAKLTQQHDFPPDRRFVADCYTHDLEKLVKIARLESLREQLAQTNSDFAANWHIVKDWEEQSRYLQWHEATARKLYSAVTDSSNGVLPWIKVHW